MTFRGEILSLSIDEVWRERERLVRCLSGREREAFLALATEKRRRDWLSGRIAAKRCVQRRTGLPFGRIALHAIESGAEEGRPRVYVDDALETAVDVSISHSGDVAMACVSNLRVGIDIEVVAPRDRAFEELVFDARERHALEALVGVARDRAVTEMWCVKEAYAKWMGTGFRAAFLELVVPAGLVVARGRFSHAGVEMIWAGIESPSSAASRIFV